MELVHEIRHGWGYDHRGYWHDGIAEVIQVQAECRQNEEDDPLALVRGTFWGLLFSAIFFWLPAAVVLLWARNH